MCDKVVGKPYNLTGKLICKCGEVAQDPAGLSTFVGHENGFDVYRLDQSVTCPTCGQENPAAEMSCPDNLGANDQFDYKLEGFQPTFKDFRTASMMLTEPLFDAQKLPNPIDWPEYPSAAFQPEKIAFGKLISLGDDLPPAPRQVSESSPEVE